MDIVEALRNVPGAVVTLFIVVLTVGMIAWVMGSLISNAPQGVKQNLTNIWNPISGMISVIPTIATVAVIIAIVVMLGELVKKK